MFSHIMVGTSDLERAKKFYDPLMATLGAGPSMVDGHRMFYMHNGGVFAVSEVMRAMLTPDPPPLKRRKYGSILKGQIGLTM